MFIDAMRENLGGVFRIIGDALRCFVSPVALGKSIRLGDKDDFRYRIRFATTIAAFNTAVQGLVLSAYDINIFGKIWDTLLQLASPVIVVLTPIVLYLPLRLLRLAKLPFSHFIQPQLAATGASVIAAPLSMAPYFWYLSNHGSTIPSDVPQADLIAQTCGEKIENMSCLGMVLTSQPTYLTAILVINLAVTVIMYGINFTITSAATGISVRRLFLAFVVFLLMVWVVAFVWFAFVSPQ